MIGWTDGDVTLKRPTIAGRYVVRDDIVTWVVHKYTAGTQLTNANLGCYQLTATTFSYGYGNRFSMRSDGQVCKVDREAPEGFSDMVLPRLRNFALKEEGGVVKANYQSARFELSRDGVIYIDDITKAVREYRGSSVTDRPHSVFGGQESNRNGPGRWVKRRPTLTRPRKQNVDARLSRFF